MIPCNVRLALSFFSFFLLLSLSPNLKAQKSPKPLWVLEYSFDENNIDDQNPGYQYLLLDNQENIVEQTDYWHFAIKVTNSEGVQNMSNISADYDPSYQSLMFHEINVIRDGVKLDRLLKSSIERVRRETNMERSLYDGTETAYTNLSDVRPGDIIEYSYSIKGYNPVNNGFYSKSASLEYAGIPVNRIVFRLLEDGVKKLKYKLNNEAPEPLVSKKGKRIEYIWDVESTDPITLDSYTPSYYNPLKNVSLSNFQDWNEVIQWARNLYQYPNSDLSKIKLEYPSNASIEYKVLKAIEFVQDEVRYLGLESGIGAYKPNSPAKVFNQRFGDCKDKSLLLVALLRDLGIESFPMLVNTTLKTGITDYLPGNNLFDHCVVAYNYNGESLYIDPTISNQGGNILNRSFPQYELGLVLNKDENQLRTLAKPKRDKIEVKEWFVLDSINGGANLIIRTEYQGARADGIRSQFASNSPGSITKGYLDFYSGIYPSIKSVENVRLIDSSRGDSNLVITEEEYQISSIWKNDEGLDYSYVEIYPIFLESLISFGDVADPTMPYSMGDPVQFKQTSVVEMPQEWEVETISDQIVGDGYKYENKLSSSGNIVTVTHEYESELSVIEPEAVLKVLKDHNKIIGELNYILTYNSSLVGFTLSIGSTVLAVLGLFLGVFVCFYVNRVYVPKPAGIPAYSSIGGWLVLPAMGLIVSIFRTAFDTFAIDYFNKSLWPGLELIGGNPLLAKFIIALEIIYNVGFLVFVFYVAFQFFTRKTRAPRLMMAFLILGSVVPIIDYLVMSSYFPTVFNAQDDEVMIREMVRAILGIIIWVPYFYKSQRVKGTFTKYSPREGNTLVAD
ncbi:DUF3857 domain-containing protein [Roseivirga sp.]|uniref:DUF3857 domain-containing protein n=1 Tax=Roseivirga sp. TaxID=1964215 RepID=UPI003B8BED93